MTGIILVGGGSRGVVIFQGLMCVVCWKCWEAKGLLFKMAGQRQVATAIGELRASCNCHWRVRALKGITISDGDLGPLYTRKLLECYCVFKTRFHFSKLWVFLRFKFVRIRFEICFLRLKFVNQVRNFQSNNLYYKFF